MQQKSSTEITIDTEETAKLGKTKSADIGI